MAIEQAIALENTIQEMGFSSITDFALHQAKEKLLQELKESLAEIDHFEQKYQMNYQQFVEKFSEINAYGILEKEDDGMEWAAEIESLKITERKLNRLN